MKRFGFGLVFAFSWISITAGFAATDRVSTAPTQSATRYAPPPVESKGLVTIFDNIAHRYPKGLYNSITGRTITGPQNQIGYAEYWAGAPFTPSGNHTFTQMQLALQSWGGTNAAIVGLYSDNAGLPGTPIKEWHVANVSGIGCCGLVTVHVKTGIPLTSGTQYWVVVKPDPAKGQDQWFAWNLNVIDQVDTNTYAYYCKDTATVVCGSAGGQWFLNTYRAAATFAIRGPN